MISINKARAKAEAENRRAVIAKLELEAFGEVHSLGMIQKTWILAPPSLANVLVMWFCRQRM